MIDIRKEVFEFTLITMKDVRKYKIVVEIAKTGSISKTAEFLKISQPTLSKYLLNLEKDLGFEIFDRTVIPIKPTILGEKFIDFCKVYLDKYHQFEKEIQDVKSNKQMLIKLGLSPSRSPYIMPKLMKEILSINPECKIIIKEQNVKGLINSLISGDLDLIISISNEDTKMFKSIKLFEEDIVLAIPNSCYKEDFYSMIKDIPVITIGEGLNLWTLTNKFVEETNIKNPTIECQSLELALSLVNESLGMLLVPNYLMNNKSYSNIKFLQLPNELKESLGTNIKRDVSIFYRKNQFLTNLEINFITMCKNHFNNEN